MTPDLQEEEGIMKPQIVQILSNYKEFENLGGYYLKIFYNEYEMTILAYNIELLEGKRYDIKMKLNDFYANHNIFKKYKSLEDIFKLIIKYIDEKKYNLSQNEKNIDFSLIIKEEKPKENEKDDFSFLLNDFNDDYEQTPNEDSNILIKLFAKENNNKNNEYINILSTEIKKIRNNNKLINFLKEENKKIKNILIKFKESYKSISDLKGENANIKLELVKLKEENMKIIDLKQENTNIKYELIKLKEENEKMNDLKLEKENMKNELLKSKEENAKINDLKLEKDNMKDELLKCKEENKNLKEENKNLKEENTNMKYELIKLKEEKNNLNNKENENNKNELIKLKEEIKNLNILKLENISIKTELIKLKDENKIINDLKLENTKYKNEINNLKNSMNKNQNIEIKETPTPTPTPINKKINLNCSECPLMAEIKLDSFYIPNIESKCPNNHKENNFSLINYLEKSKRHSKDNFKCQCEENNITKKDLYYCKDCNSFICNKCWTNHSNENPKHKLLFDELINFKCIEHKKDFSSYCKECQDNLCSECIKNHKGHEIEDLDLLILSEDELTNIIKRKDKIISHLEKIKKTLDSYKNEWLEKIELLKNYYDLEINLFEEIISQYSKNKYNYQNIKNLRNIYKFSLDNTLFEQYETVFKKTDKILLIFNKINTQKITENPINKIIKRSNTTPLPQKIENKNLYNIKFIKEIKLEQMEYSLCYLKKHNLIALGGKRVELYNTDFKYISSYNLIDAKVAYISELSDGKILAVQSCNKITILEIENNNTLQLIQNIETKNENYNFVGIEISNKDIICGGNQYLSIIGPSIFILYWVKNSINLKGFISNIVELDSYTFLVGQSQNNRILIFSNSKYEIINEIKTEVYGNNYSISKVTNEFAAIGGTDYIKAIVNIYSINRRVIYDKYISGNRKCCHTITKVNDDCFMITLESHEKIYDLMFLRQKKVGEEYTFEQVGYLKDAFFNTVEAMISFNNYVIISDTLGKLIIWKVE